MPWLLVADSLIFQAEAEIRWLDHCETALVRYSMKNPVQATPTKAAETAPERTTTS